MDYRKEILMHLYNIGAYSLTDVTDFVKSLGNDIEVNRTIQVLNKNEEVSVGSQTFMYFATTNNGLTRPYAHVKIELKLEDKGRRFVREEYVPKEATTDNSQHLTVHGDLSGNANQSRDFGRYKIADKTIRAKHIDDHINTIAKNLLHGVGVVITGLIVAYIVYKMGWI